MNRKTAMIMAFLLAGTSGLAGCAGDRVKWVDCFDLADVNVRPEILRRAPKVVRPGWSAQDQAEICDGLALLSEQKWEEAIASLTKAEATTPSEKRWSIIGYLARAYMGTKDYTKALQLWDEAIPGAMKARNQRREHVFRGDRAITYARMGDFGAAIIDVREVVEKTKSTGVRTRASYLGFKLSISAKNLNSAAKWYALTMKTAKAVSDLTMQKNATTIYGQFLDDNGKFADSESMYSSAVSQLRDGGSKLELADVFEFYGQSRFAAADYRGGERYYGQAAQTYREAGQLDYAVYLERNMRSKLSRFELGYVCADLIAKGNLDAAAQSVSDVPTDRRSAMASICLAQTFVKKGDPARGQLLLGSLLEKQSPGSDCQGIGFALIGMGGTPQSKCFVPERQFPVACVPPIETMSNGQRNYPVPQPPTCYPTPDPPRSPRPN